MPNQYTKKIPLPTRFWSMADTSNGLFFCWLWTGYVDTFGYGRIRVNNTRMDKAHRVAYKLLVGPIPEGLHVCHSCDVRHCVNPSHLFLGTHAENMADMAKKGRTVDRKGEDHPRARLTEVQVRDIRTRYARGGVTQEGLGREYGVPHSAISLIIRRVNWKHIK